MKLRAILLYEADFNQNNKFLGCAMMGNAEIKNCWPARSNMAAIDQCLNKQLTFF
jgi:hypothetical protein